MKQNTFNKILISLSIVFLILQFVYSQIKLKTGVYNKNIRYMEYVVMGLIMITTLVYAKKENKEFFKRLLIVYLVLIILFILFLLRGVI